MNKKIDNRPTKFRITISIWHELKKKKVEKQKINLVLTANFRPISNHCSLIGSH